MAGNAGDPLGTQPDFQQAATEFRIASRSLGSAADQIERCSNLPAITGYNNIIAEITAAISASEDRIMAELVPIKNDVATLKVDVATLKVDVATLKVDVVTLRDDLHALDTKLAARLKAT